jgi:hypothetical protein
MDTDFLRELLATITFERIEPGKTKLTLHLP